jgi:hypothetical protein
MALDKLQKYIDTSEKYIVQGISELTEKQKLELEDLATRIDKAGATKPLTWALSEVKENIPQFGRFLVLKSFLQIAKDARGNVFNALDFDEKIEEKYLEISKMVGEKEFLDFLYTFSKGLMINVCMTFDEGNLDCEEDKVSWEIFQTDENGEHSGRIIQGLHEDWYEFEKEIRKECYDFGDKK